MRPGQTFTRPGVVNPTTGLPSPLANVLIGRRNVEGGGRDDDLEHTDYRIVAGIKGDLLRGLSYDAYYQFGTSRRAETYFNDFSVTRLQRSIDVIANPAVGGVAGVPAGTPVCRSAIPGGGDPNCVPWDIFTTGNVSHGGAELSADPGLPARQRQRDRSPTRT